MDLYPHTFSGRRASQSEFELRSFITFLQENNVTRYLEIGARDGDTFHEVMSHLPYGSFGIAVDLPGGLWGKSSTIKNLNKSIIDLKNNGYMVDKVIGDSTKQRIVDFIREQGPFDAILIDGDHTYEGVKKDWINYRELAPIVAFHDIVGFDQAEKRFGNRVEVPKLWKEIKHDRCLEFVGQDSKMGIGVYVG